MGLHYILMDFPLDLKNPLISQVGKQHFVKTTFLQLFQRLLSSLECASGWCKPSLISRLVTALPEKEPASFVFLLPIQHSQEEW